LTLIGTVVKPYLFSISVVRVKTRVSGVTLISSVTTE
jgi:hypothetical protein